MDHGNVLMLVATPDTPLACAEHHDRRQAQQRTDRAAKPFRARRPFLCDDVGGNDCNPKEVHNASDEQQRHQHPAAADAKSAVAQALTNRDCSARRIEHRTPWRTAADETGVLQRRELEETSDCQHGGA